MEKFWAELLGTAIIIILGEGVVAGVVLKDTKSENSGWIVITTTWALAVIMGIFVSGKISGAHLNPAVTLGLAATGGFDWAEVPTYLLAQMLGAMIGACVVYVHYLPHWSRTDDAGAKLAVFATGPAIRHTTANFMSEFIGTFILMFGITAIGANKFSEGINPFAVGGLVFAIGLGLGGTTGYAINPARDLGPRIMHAILPIPGKGSSDWGYAWIPVVGPILGGIAGTFAYKMLLGV